DVLERAWEVVRANRGAAGIDRQTIAMVEGYGVAKLLDELAADLKEGRWRPLPARRVFIPKPGRPSERRPLSIPAVATAWCKRPQRSSLSRSSRLTCSSARSGFAPGARRTTLSRCSLMRRGEAGGGSPSRTSPTALRRSRTRG